VPGDIAVVVCNFTPAVRHSYRVGVPRGGLYTERLNSDSQAYGGSNVGNAGAVMAAAIHCQGRPFSLDLTLPPLATLVLVPQPRGCRRLEALRTTDVPAGRLHRTQPLV
jgi:1,4-alpha-glucan branching enzyme